jgi:hypothetical protein
MPRATSTGTSTERYDLKTLPPQEGEEGGYVVLRRMTYGEFMKRRNMTGLRFEQHGKQGMQGFLDMVNSKVTEYEMSICIVEHNLEDDNGNLLDFKKPQHIRQLDPRVGEEISTLIDKMNQFDDEDDESPLESSEID